MRRKDREMDKGFGLAVIDKAQCGVLSVVDKDNEPYSIPLSIVREGDKLYFHSAKEGTKIDLFESDPMVSVVFVGDVKVPDLYSKEELELIAKDDKKSTALASTVFTTQYESTVVKGKVKKVDNLETKIKVLKLICKKYTPDKLDYFDSAVRSGLERTSIYSIDIQEITSKRKRFDQNGEEMKWGRME